MTEPISKTMPGIVEAIINSPDPSQPERAQIAIQVADEFMGKIRVVNILTDKDGGEVSLKKGEPVKVTIKA